jgi:acyl carrier protein
MNTQQIILDAIERIAPDVDVTSVPVDVDFRDEVGLDSMDFLAVLNTVRDAIGVEVPEADYHRIRTVREFAEYLDGRAAGRPT